MCNEIENVEAKWRILYIVQKKSEMHCARTKSSAFFAPAVNVWIFWKAYI